MTERASKSIHDDAILPPNCYECENLRFGIWRSAVAPSDSAEKNGNMDAQHNYRQVNFQKYFGAPKYLGKLTSCMTLGRTNLFVPSRFCTRPTCTNFDSYCQHYIATCKIFFI